MTTGAGKRQVSSLKWDYAGRYRRRYTRRFMTTTMVVMISVEASNTSKWPESLALLMVLPRARGRNNASLKMEVLGDDAGVPRSAGGDDHAGTNCLMAMLLASFNQSAKRRTAPGSLHPHNGLAKLGNDRRNPIERQFFEQSVRAANCPHRAGRAGDVMRPPRPWRAA
jgi:hypothetical protein